VRHGDGIYDAINAKFSSGEEIIYVVGCFCRLKWGLIIWRTKPVQFLFTFGWLYHAHYV